MNKKRIAVICLIISAAAILVGETSQKINPKYGEFLEVNREYCFRGNGFIIIGKIIEFKNDSWALINVSSDLSFSIKKGKILINLDQCAISVRNY